MNTIVVNIDEIDLDKYIGCESPFMFDNFNLVLYSKGQKTKIEVRDNPHGLVYRVNKDIWVGIRACNDTKEIYPEKELMTIGEFEDGDIYIGEFFMPIKMLNEKQQDILSRCLASEKGYSYYMQMNRLLSSLLCTIMMEGKERKREQRKIIKTNRNIKSNTNDAPKKDKVYLLNDIVNYIADNYVESNNHHKIKCPCWDVRGHYRRYKTGKIVFIPSYKKGNQRETEQPISKQYVLSKGGE